MDIQELVISLIITIFAYLAIPIFIRWYFGRIDKKAATKYAIINSIVVRLIFLVIELAIGGEVGNMAAAVTYFFIARWIMSKK